MAKMSKKTKKNIVQINICVISLADPVNRSLSSERFGEEQQFAGISH